jgi:tryptophanyl-tRNA synthetase
VDVPV